MPHKFDPHNMAKLEERRKIMPPGDILLVLGLKSGETMIDIGAGSGYFSLPASEIVGEKGNVIAIDTSKEMIEELASQVKKSSAQNITVVLSQEYDLAVEDNQSDFAFICTVLHEIEDKILFLKAVRNVMKPNSKLAIVEWAKKPMEKGPPLQDRIGMPEAEDLLNGLGFHGIHATVYNEYFYFVTTVK
jgi:ubiquinone/menaquinone biosynthesis C-methylase UbiE